MASKSFSLALLGGIRRRLSDVYADGVDGGSPADNIPYRFLFIQTTGADTFIGDAAVTATQYSQRIESAGDRQVKVGPYETGPLKLSDYYVVTAAAPTTVHVLGIPF